MKKMAGFTGTFLNREELPVVAGLQGRAATKPMVSIGDNGRISLNKLASAPLVAMAAKYIDFGWDAPSRTLAIRGHVTIPKNRKESEFWPIQVGKENKSVTVASAQPLTHVCKYDYRAAGHQSYDASVDPKTGLVYFAVPAETPARKPVVTRRKRVTTTVTETPVTTGQAA